MQQLAGSSKGIIYCLVRRQNFLDPEAFKQEFERYNLGFTDRLISRIKPILGDIEQPLFGLSKAEFDGLGESLAQIFFIAGKVNLIADYTILRKSNVQALENAFRLSEVNGCRLSYVSSNTINDITNNYSCEQIVDNGIAASVSGYDLTKVISEKMLFDHLIDGNKVSVIRVGDVVPENVSSPLNKNSILAYLMELMNSVGAVPDVDITMDIISAAELSRRLVYCKEPFLCLTKPESFTRFFSERCSDCSIVSIETFVDRVTNVNNLNRGAEFVRGILCSSKNIPLDEVIYKNFIRPFTPVDEKGLALNYIAGLFSSPETYKEDLVAIS